MKHNLAQIQQTTEVNWGQRTGQQYETFELLQWSLGQTPHHSLSLQPRSGLHIYIVKIFGHQIVFFYEIKLVYTKKKFFWIQHAKKSLFKCSHIWWGFEKEICLSSLNTTLTFELDCQCILHSRKSYFLSIILELCSQRN